MGIGTKRSDDDEVSYLGAVLNYRRTNAGLTPDDLAQKVGAPRSYISDIERGRAGTELERAIAVFRAVGVRLIPVTEEERAYLVNVSQINNDGLPGPGRWV